MHMELTLPKSNLGTQWCWYHIASISAVLPEEGENYAGVRHPSLHHWRHDRITFNSWVLSLLKMWETKPDLLILEEQGQPCKQLCVVYRYEVYFSKMQRVTEAKIRSIWRLCTADLAQIAAPHSRLAHVSASREIHWGLRNPNVTNNKKEQPAALPDSSMFIPWITACFVSKAWVPWLSHLCGVTYKW